MCAYKSLCESKQEMARELERKGEREIQSKPEADRWWEESKTSGGSYKGKEGERAG